MREVSVPTVLDKTPVNGEGMAIQSYIDLGLSKDDLVDAIIAQQTTKYDDELTALKEEDSDLSQERTKLLSQSKVWIKERFDRKYGDKVQKLSELLDTKGRYSFTVANYDPMYVTVCWKAEVDNVSIEVKLREENHEDQPTCARLKEIKKREKEISARKSWLQTNIQAKDDRRKTVRLRMAKEILNSTKQGKQLLSAMSLDKVAKQISNKK